jgi:hypothetical protein
MVGRNIRFFAFFKVFLAMGMPVPRYVLPEGGYPPCEPTIGLRDLKMPKLELSMPIYVT